MTTSHIQTGTRFSKINHAYFFLDAVHRKDYLNAWRHFLWAINQGDNQPLTQKSLVSTLADLTIKLGLDKQRIENVLCAMGKAGEIERFKNVRNRVGWNPDITNQSKYSPFLSSYVGKPIRTYSKEEAEAEIALKKLGSPIFYTPRDAEDMKNIMLIEENMELNTRVKTLEEKVASNEDLIHNSQDRIKILEHSLAALLRKEPRAEEDAKRHLSIVPNDND